MKSRVQMLTIATIIALLITLFPIKILAVETTNANLEIVQTNENKYIIYIQDLQKTEFTYAIATTKTPKENELKYIYSTKDKGENQVALIDNTVCDLNKNKKVYLWVKKAENQIISAKEINLETAVKKSQIEEVENTTKRIKTEIISDLLEEEKTDEQGVKITVKVGGIQIKDEEDAKYFYQIISAVDENEELMTLAEKLKNEYNDANMYEKIKMSTEFYQKYQTLISKANWQSVENMQIKQPKTATENSKYIVFIKKVKNNAETYDVQFLTSKEEQNPTYEREKKIVQETTKLPITGDSIVLLVAGVIVISAMIFVFIRMKKLKNKNRK